MKKIICVFLLLCVIVVGGFLVFRFFYPSTGEKLSKKTYSVTELVPRTDELESGLCNKIEATYSDMSGKGKGERVTRSITDKETVDKIQNDIGDLGTAVSEIPLPWTPYVRLGIDIASSIPYNPKVISYVETNATDPDTEYELTLYVEKKTKYFNIHNKSVVADTEMYFAY